MRRLPKPCNAPGCPALVETPERYCPNHQHLVKEGHRQYKRDRTDTVEQAFYTSARWRRARAFKLRRNPLCEVCESRGLLVPAAIVHHREEIKVSDQWLVLDNLQSVCVACHNQIHKGKGEGASDPGRR